LVLDEIWAEPQHFIQDRACDSPESMAAPFLLLNPHAAHGGKTGVVTHWP
jgi:hypothetical protein